MSFSVQEKVGCDDARQYRPKSVLRYAPVQFVAARILRGGDPMSIPKSRMLLCCVALLMAGPAGAETWRWRDADGNVHFGDRPPSGVQAERLKTPSKPAPAEGEAGARRLEQLRSDEAARKARREAADTRARRRADADAGDRAQQRSRCDRARWALAALETARPVYRDANGAYRIKRSPNEPDIYTGPRQYLEAPEREAEIARYQRDMGEYCVDFPELQDKQLADEDLRHAEACEFAQAQLQQLEEPESRATPEEIAARRQFLEQECWAP
jgi:hypothetical protein